MLSLPRRSTNISLYPPNDGGGGGGGSGSGGGGGNSPFDPNNPFGGSPGPSASGQSPFPSIPGPPGPPNWQSILANNPYYLSAQALGAEQLAALKAQMGASAARALINLGDYSLADKFSGFNLPSDTKALVDQANKSGTSILSQLGYQHDRNQQSIPAVLAGRGFYRSGETGYELGNENKMFGNKEFSARQQTLDYLNNLYQSYLNAQFGIQQNELNAYYQAYQQAMQEIGSYAQQGTTPVSTNPFGDGVLPPGGDNANYPYPTGNGPTDSSIPWWLVK